MFTIRTQTLEVSLRNPDLENQVSFEKLKIVKTLPTGIVVALAPTEWPVPCSYSYRFQLVPRMAYVSLRDLLHTPVTVEWAFTVFDCKGVQLPFPHGNYEGVISSINWAVERRRFNLEDLSSHDVGSLDLVIERDGTLEGIDGQI